MTLLVLNGPNLRVLERREGYGGRSLDEGLASLRALARTLGVALAEQTADGEDGLVRALNDTDCDGVIVNPGACAHYSLAVADAMAAAAVPVVEVHLTNPLARRRAVTARSADALVVGMGFVGYELALRFLKAKLSGE